jgi:hypothetical protein
MPRDPAEIAAKQGQSRACGIARPSTLTSVFRSKYKAFFPLATLLQPCLPLYISHLSGLAMLQRHQL